MDSNNESPTLHLSRELIRRASVTPDDAGCNQLLMDRLSALGFDCEVMNFGEVSNFWARSSRQGPVLCFAGHTDVVPSGPETAWQSPPFEPQIRDGLLYGRGSADMKGSLAAMITACERFFERRAEDGRPVQGTVAFLITSDEEGAATHGTRKVVETLQARNEHIDYCIVGEPSSSRQLGDVIKIGRRGSLHGLLRFHGIQGHIAYPQFADNPVHKALAPLKALCDEVWDEGNEAFPPTSFQISNIEAGTGVTNVIPGELSLRFNFRYSTEVTDELLRERTEAILDAHDVKWSIDWILSGKPFLTSNSRFVDQVRESIRSITGLETEASTGGGTSDGRYIAPTGTELVEVGPINASIHKIDEHVLVQDLDKLSLIYEEILGRVLLPETSA